MGLLGVIALVPALIPSAVAADGQYGATVPYTRYEAEEASRSDGTALERSDDLESTAIEASGQSYVALKDQDSSLDFTATSAANALDLRFTLPDHKSGQVQVYINNDLAATLTLSSETAWPVCLAKRASMMSRPWRLVPPTSVSALMRCTRCSMARSSRVTMCASSRSIRTIPSTASTLSSSSRQRPPSSAPKVP